MLNVSENLDPSRLRVDMDARIPTGKRGFMDIGLQDIGLNTRLNLQNGIKMSDQTSMRYGIYASRLGAGLEWNPSDGFGIRGDLYDTSKVRLDLRGIFRVDSGVSFWVGGDNLLQNPTPLIGIQIKK